MGDVQYCTACGVSHHSEASFCVKRQKPDAVLPPPTKEQIAEEDVREAADIAALDVFLADRKKPQ